MFKRLKLFFKSKSNDNLYKINGAVPLGTGIFCGLQHVLAMFVANITPVIIVFAGHNNDLISLESAIIAAIFIAGIGTLIQLFSIWRIGSKLPIVVGISFTFVGVLSQIAITYGLGTMFGSTLVGGLLIGTLGLFAKYWRKLIKPIVPCVVILAIGLSLIPIGVEQFVGGNTLETLTIGTVWPFIVVGFVTLISYLLFTNLFKNWVKNLAIIFSILIGYSLCLILHFTSVANFFDFSSLQVKTFTDVIDFPRLINLGALKFDLGAIIIVTIVYLVGTTEAIGDMSAITFITEGRNATDRELSGGIAGDGYVSALASLFGALPLTTFSQNVGIIKETKICNRMTIFFGAIFLILVSFFPIVAKVIITIPEPVLGGCMVILFSSIVVVAMEMLSNLGFTKKNVIIVSVSLGLGYGLSLLSMSSKFQSLFDSMSYVGILLSNPVTNMFIISLLLSFIIKDRPKPVTELGQVAE